MDVRGDFLGPPHGSKALLECINVLDREEPKASWKISKNSEGFSLVIRTFAATNVTPLKAGQSASKYQQESHTDKSTDDLLLKKSGSINPHQQLQRIVLGFLGSRNLAKPPL